jgi:acetyl-CoA C-acetyltransferase
MGSEDSIVIIDGARTPMGSFGGVFSSMTAVELGAIAIEAAVKKAGINPEDVDEVYMGCVLQAGLGQAPARQAAISAGVPNTAGAVTVNKVCGSGMQAAIFAHDQIMLGSAQIAVAGGMESMTNAPHLLMNARSGIGTGHKEMLDSMFLDGLEDAYTANSMGKFAQDTADSHGLTREEMDVFAIESLNRANQAIDDDLLDDEIIPVFVKTRRDEVVVRHDEQPQIAKVNKIPSLRPAFTRDGTITAANSSSISDGASALVLAGAYHAQEIGLSPMAKIVAYARHSHSPEEFTTAPIGSIKKIFEMTGWDKDSTDLFEVNEAFAMVALLTKRELELDPDKVNVHGGACAQGHPLGSTASRVIVSLMYALKRYGKKRGIASMCIGGGEALAMAIEMV